jgi:hypothetical protein
MTGAGAEAPEPKVLGTHLAAPLKDMGARHP